MQHEAGLEGPALHREASWCSGARRGKGPRRTMCHARMRLIRTESHDTLSNDHAASLEPVVAWRIFVGAGRPHEGTREPALKILVLVWQ